MVAVDVISKPILNLIASLVWRLGDASHSFCPTSSADTFCKQFGPRSEPTERQSRSGSKPFDTLIVFLNFLLKKFVLKKSQQTTTNAPNITQHAKSLCFCVAVDRTIKDETCHLLITFANSMSVLIWIQAV